MESTRRFLWLAAIVAAVSTAIAVGAPRSDAADEPPAPNLAAADSIAAYASRYGIGRRLAGLIYREAVQHGIAPGMVFALIDTESDFDANAVGPSGALGLMQIRPSTARAYDRGVTVARLHDPVVNLRLGLRHLKAEIDHFGDRALALAAYNRGRAGLRRALARGVDPLAGYAGRVLARCAHDCS